MAIQKIDRNIVTAEHKSEGCSFVSHTIATDDFGTILPIHTQQLQAGDHFDLNVKQFTRLLPLNAPTFGSIENTIRGFLVPLHLVFRGWFDFLKSQPITDKNGNMGTYRMPYFTTRSFLNYHLLGAYKEDATQILPGESVMGLKLARGSVRSRSFIKAPYDIANKFINLNPEIFKLDVNVNMPERGTLNSDIHYDKIQTAAEESKALFEINSVYVGYSGTLSSGKKSVYNHTRIARELHANNDLVINNIPFLNELDDTLKSHRCSIGVPNVDVDYNIPSEISDNNYGICEFLNNLFNITEEQFKFPLVIDATLVTQDLGTVDSKDLCVFALGLKLTRRGRKLFHLLQGLGYNIELPELVSWALIYGYDIAENIGQYDWIEPEPWKFRHNVLPLACWSKFYFDWVIPARWIDTNVYRSMRELYDSWHYFFIGTEDGEHRFDVLDYAFVSEQPKINESIENMLNPDLFCQSWFVDDYFMSALPSPWADSTQRSGLQLMLNGSSGSSSMAGVQSPLNSIDMNDEGRVANVNANFDLYSLQTLGVLTSMLKRGLFNGTKVQDWLINEFGLRPDVEILDCCRYLGHKAGQININSVMAQSSSEFGPDGVKGNDLGEYAGQGNFDSFNNPKAQFNKQLEQIDESSILIITHELMPHPMYFQGVRPHTSALNVYDYYTPSFDGVGFDAITLNELVGTSQGSDFDNENYKRFLMAYKEKFGFQPRYTKWKISYDNLLGDFRVNSINTGLDSWYMNRKISEIPDNVLINPDWQFASEGMPNNNSDRIFKNNTQDHFYSIYEIILSGSSKVIPIRKAIRFQESDGRTLTATDGSVE